MDIAGNISRFAFSDRMDPANRAIGKLIVYVMNPK
jgi:hypothetical protein